MQRSILSRPILFALGFGFASMVSAPTLAQTRGQQSPNTQVAAPKPALDLVARNTRADRQAVAAQSLNIETLDVAVKIAGNLVETTLTARFANPNSQVLEGDFTLDLPREAWVTGFGLDVNGVMIDGVLQPKAKAAEAYEENLRRGVDPGLGEVNAANQFRTRIFPINPQSGRTVKITYVSLLDATGTYQLPLTSAGAVGKTTVSVSNEGNARPRVTLPRGLRATDVSGTPLTGNAAQGLGDGYGQTLGQFQGQNEALVGNLVISNLGPNDALRLMTSRGGETYFNVSVPAAPVAASQPKFIRLYWDASRSRRDDDLGKEVALIEQYVRQSNPDRLELIVFSDGAPRITLLDRAQLGTLGATLRDVRYQGASRFADLERLGAGDADVCLVVSDGQLTMDSFKLGNWPCKVVTISSSTAARRDILEGLAETNRGRFIDLKALSVTDALVALQVRGPDLRSVTTSTGAPVDYSLTTLPDGRYSLTGPKPEGDELILKTYGAERRLSLRDAAVSGHQGGATLYGVQQVKRASATDNPDPDALLALVRRYGVATTDYSYLVLETAEDYARNNIAPSPSVGKEFLARYQLLRTQIVAAETTAKEQRLTAVLRQWDEQKTWWKTRFNSAPRPQNQNQNRPGDVAASAPEQVVVTGARRAAANEMVAPPPPPPAPPPPIAESRSALAAPSPTARSEVSRDRTQREPTGQQAQNPEAMPRQSTIAVTAAAWNPSRPYLTALRVVKPGDNVAFEPIYRAQETQFGNTPAFYFDMAEWAHRNGFAAQAAGIARNALELPSTSVNTKIILASRLTRYGAFDQAIWLNERILQATPNKPQALRNLALSIKDATDAGRASGTIQSPAAIAAYERALGLLMKIVLTPNNGDYDGIELIALMEANHIVGTLKQLGVNPERISAQIDQRLVTLMAVDIRVTMEWNTDKTDMDLWVDEPTGERAIYSNPRTAIGGRLSNDMTRGYGPEEYLLNVAPNGTYKVLSNAFAADQLDPNGPSSLTVKLYRDWGRPTEKVETFVVELNRGQSQTVEVGRFVKGPAQPATPAVAQPVRPPRQ